MRGVSSLSLSNAPIWVVDGVRFNSAPFSAAGAGGTQINSTNLNGLNPEAWLRDVLTRIGDRSINRLDELLLRNMTRRKALAA